MLPRAADVQFRVFDVRGRVVDVRALGTVRAGIHSLEFDAKRFGSGIYWYELRTAGHALRHKMIVVR